MNAKLLLLSALLIFTCCDRSGDRNEILISKNYRSAVHIDDIFSEYEFIRLQTSDSVVVGSPRKILRDGESIYISDGRSLFRFSMAGAHISTLHREGRAPGEYSQISDFDLTEDGSIVLDRNNKMLLRYDSSDRFVDSYPLGLFVSSIRTLDDCRVLLHNAYQRESGDKLLEYDLCTKKLSGGFWPIHESHYTYRHFMEQKNFYEYDGKLIFHEPMNNTIYEIADNAATVRYDLNLYGRNPPQDFWNSRYADIMDIMNDLNGSGYCYGTPVYAESDDQLLFTFRDPEKYMMCLYDKREGTSVQFDAVTISSDGRVSIGVADINLNATSPENMIFCISGDKFFDGNDELLSDEFSGVEMFGNPVICVATLK